MHDQQPFGTPLSLDVALQVLYAKRFRELYNSIQSEDDVLREELRKLYPPPSTPGSSATPASSSTPVPDAVPDSVPPPLPIATPSRDAPSAVRRGSTGPASSPTRAPGADTAAPVSAADQSADAAALRAEDRSTDSDARMAVDSPPCPSETADEPMDVDTSPVSDSSSTTAAAAPAPAPTAVTPPASPPAADGTSTPLVAATIDAVPPSVAATDAAPAPATHPLTQVMAMDVDTDPDTAPSSEHSSELAIALPDSDAHAIALPDPTPTSPSAFPPWAGPRRGSREDVKAESSASADGGGEGAEEEDGEDGNDETSEVISLDVEFSDTMSEARSGAAAPTRVKDEDAEDAEDAVVAAAARALRETTAGSDVTMGETTSSSEPVSRTASVDATTSAAPALTAAPAAAPARRGRRASLKQGDDKYKAWRRLCLHKWDDIASLRLGNTFQSHGGRRDTDLGETYRAVIKQPMDLKTIRQRVRDGSVHATDEFHRDLLLMLANTCMYYPPGSDWHAMALEMKGEVEVQMAQFRSVEAAAAARVAGGVHGGSPALSAAAGATTPDARPVLGRRDVSPSPLPEPMVVSAAAADGDEGESGVAVKTEMG
ncbi:hypothetical protein GGF32_009089 [Allomyces javanicus]|nr:hypothetical protein GGF32_009089 [Allomyces javanicus]